MLVIKSYNLTLESSYSHTKQLTAGTARFLNTNLPNREDCGHMKIRLVYITGNTTYIKRVWH